MEARNWTWGPLQDSEPTLQPTHETPLKNVSQHVFLPTIWDYPHMHTFFSSGAIILNSVMSRVCLVNFCSVTVPFYPLYVLFAISCLIFSLSPFGWLLAPLSVGRDCLASMHTLSSTFHLSILAWLDLPPLFLLLSSHQAHSHTNPSYHVMVFIVLTFSCSTSFHCFDTDQ